MIKIENVDVFGWEAAIRGMRNPMNSWDKSDSGKGCTRKNWNGEVTSTCEDCEYIRGDKVSPCYPNKFIIGENDLKLMRTLSKAGNDHGKFLRMINVTCDITAPLYWWKEFDTYKVGTVANSCSTMHKIHAKEFELDDFSHEYLISDWVGDNNDAMYYWRPTRFENDWFASPIDGLRLIIGLLNSNREAYLKTHNKKYWWQMIQLLPSSYNQKRTVQLNYQVLKSMYFARRNHKLDDWVEFCKWIETLPYAKELICCDCN